MYAKADNLLLTDLTPSVVLGLPFLSAARTRMEAIAKPAPRGSDLPSKGSSQGTRPIQGELITVQEIPIYKTNNSIPFFC